MYVLVGKRENLKLGKSSEGGGGGRVLNISLGGEVWPGPSYPDPV